MIFSSLQYLLFLPLIVILYWRTKGSVRTGLLILASYYFYMSWLPVYGILLLTLTVANWLIGQSLFKTVTDGGRYSPKAKWLLGLGLVLNLGCLFYYKYTNFFVESVVSSYNGLVATLLPFVPSMSLTPVGVPVFNILLPLAISFFVFEFVHYLVDIWRGSAPVKFFNFVVFSSFFPSQIAGPIKRYQEFDKQLDSPERWSSQLFFEGVGLFVQGLFKKVALADPIGSLILPYFSQHGALSGPDAWLAAIGFVVQVYCDFSAYTDMGRGSALLLGIRLPENFNLPYLSQDITDFWRRWHMSLGSWLRDYVFIPLGGSRKNGFLTWRNLFLTMVVCGFWHGANWHYVIFGAIQGVGLGINREWRLVLRKRPGLAKAADHIVVGWFNNFLTMAFVMVSYIVFRAPDMGRAFNMIGALFNFSGPCTIWEPVVKAGVVPLLGVYMSAWLLTELITRYPEPFRFLRDPKLGYAYPLKLATWTAAVILTVAGRPMAAIPFVYFQF